LNNGSVLVLVRMGKLRQLVHRISICLHYQQSQPVIIRNSQQAAMLTNPVQRVQTVA